MDQGPRQTPGFLGSVPRTVRFQWKEAEAGDAFPERVPFIREVLFGALGLGLQDLVCAQRNNAARFFDVSMSSEEVYQRVLGRGADVRDHPLGRSFELHFLGQNGRRMVTVHLFNPFVTAEAIRTFLRRYGEVQPGERMVRDELGIWNGRRQFIVEFREDGKGGLTHPPAYFSLNGSKGYLFYRGQPAFCRGCLQHGHEVSGCKDLNCKNCLGKGHLAKDCKNPRRCKSCGGEGHLAHSCPRREATYATVVAGAGVGPVAPRTVREEGPTEVGAEGNEDLGAPAAAIATSSPGVARGPAPGRPPLTGNEAPSISRPTKRAKKRRRAQEEEMDKRQRAGSPGAAPEGAPRSPPVPPKTEDTSVLVGDGTPPPPLIYGGREVPPNEDAYLDGLESVGELTILTTNVRGLQKATKRTAVFRDLASTSASICCLQEVHLRDQRDEALFSQEWRRGKAYWSVGGVHSTGVGILFGDRSFEKVSPFTIAQGRALGVDATWRGQNLRVLCVYAPVDPSSRIAFLEALAPFCYTNRHVVVAGDFNINLEGRDDASVKHFKKLVAGFSLIDGFKVCNPGNPGHTWHNSRGASSRIDYILVAPPITVRTASLSPRWYSDHMMVETTVSIDAPSFGRGYWKLNVGILEEIEYQSLFRDHFAAWLGCKSDFASPAAWWEHIKERIRALTIHYCSQRKAAKLQRVRDLEKQLKTSYADYNNGGVFDLDRAQALRAELRALHERSAADSLFNARLQMAEENETCSAFFFQRVRQAREERCFTSLIDSEGRACSDPARMMGIAHSFYSNLFSKRGTDQEIGEHFLSFLGTSLPSAARDSLETPFSLGELTEVLGKMNRRKVPGLDGLPVEFYSTFWDVLGPEIVEVAEDVHRQGRLTESMRSGALSLLYKKGDPKDLANWRPLTMLCVDLKIFAKALTERLKKTMSLLVHSDQTCGVPGRSATWNLHLIRDAISWAGDRNVPLALVSLDQEKAFDRVDHSFLERVLMTLGFGPNFLRWLKTFYTEVGSRVSINGHLSDLVPQESGVRQGCPLSPLLYALYIEPLAAAIRAHPGIDGLPIPGGGGKVVKLAQYADDTTLFVRSDQSLRLALDMVQAFGNASGAALNLGKSVVKYFGRWTDRKDAAGGLALSDGPLKILGVSFMQEGAARANWEQRLDIARRKMGLWKSRSLSFLGKVLALKADILPSLLYLAHVYPMPRSMRRGLTRDVFNLMWGGRYEYVKREVMYLGKDRGGRDVPDIPLKLDCLFFAQHYARLAAPLEHPHQYFVRLWLSWPLRLIVSTWSNSGPKAETWPDHYQHLVRWSKLLPAGLRPEAFVRHRILYKEVLNGRGYRAVVGLEEDTWSRVQPKGLDNRLQDLNWQCVHGKLPVREVLYRRGLTRHPRCPRPACAKDESLRHVFWECGYARATWSKVDGLCRALDPQFVLTYEKVMRGWSHDTRSPFLSRMWLLVSVTKRELWNARTSLIQKGTILDIVGIYRKICADLRFRMEHDVIRWGYHAAKERWRDLFELQKRPRPDLKPAQREDFMKLGSPCQSAGDKKRGRSGSSRCLLPSASVLGRRQVCGGSGAPRWRCSCKGTFALNGAEAAHGFGVGRVAQDGRRRGWPGCPELTGRAPAVCGVCLGRDPFEVTVRQKRPRPDLKPAQREDFMKLGSPCQSAGDKKRGRSGSSRCLLPSASVLGRRQVCGGSGAPRWRCSCKGTFALNGAEAAHGFGVGRVAQDGRRRGWPGCPELTGRAPAVCGVCLGRDPFEVTVRQKRPRPDLKPAQREDFMKLGSPCQSAGDKKRGRSGSSRCLLPSASVLGRRQVCGGSGARRSQDRETEEELAPSAPRIDPVLQYLRERQKRPRPDLKPAQREDFMKLGSPCQSAGDKKRGRSGSSRCLLPSASVLGRRQVCGGSGAPRWRCSCKGTFALNGAEAAHGFGVGRVAQDGRRRGWPGCPELTGRAPAVCGVCLGRDPFEVTVRQKRPRPDLKPAQREDFMKLGSPCQSAGDKKRGRSGSSRCLLPSASVLGRRQVCGGSGAPRWRCSCKGTFALNGAEAAHGFGVGRVAQDGRRRGWPGCPELTGRAPAVCGVCLGRDPFEVTVRQKRPRPDLKPAQREDFMKLGSPCQSAGDKKRGRSGSSRCLLPSASVLGRRQVCGGSGAPRWRCSCKGTFALNGAEAAHGFGVGRVAQDGRRRGWPGCPELTGRAPAVCGVCLGRDPFEVTVRQKRPRPDLKPAQREDFMKLGSPCQSAGDKKRGRSGSSRCLLPSASVLGRRQVCGGSGAPRWRCSCKGTFALNGAEAAHGFGVGRVAQDGRRRGWPGCPELTGRAPAVCGVCLGRDPFEVTVRQKRPRPDLKPAQREDFMKLGSPCQSAGDKKRGRSGSSRCLLPSASVLGRRQVCGGSGAPRWRCSCKGTFALNGAEAAHGFGVGRVAQDGRRRGWPGCPELTGRAPAVCGVCLGRDPFEVTVRQKRPRPDLKPAQREDFMKLGSPCQSAGDKKRGRSGSSRCLLPSASVLGRRQVCGGSGAPRWRCSCKGTFALNGAEAAHGFGVGRVAQDGRRRGWPGCPELTGRAPAVCGVCLGRDPFEVTVRQKRPRPDLKPAQREDFMKLGSPCQSAGDKKRGRSGSSRCLLPSASVLGRRQVCGGSGAPRWRCSCKGTFALNGAEAAHGFGVGRVAQDGRRRGWPGCPELTGRAPAVCGVCLGRDPFEVTVRQKRPRPDLKPAQREDFMKLGSPCQSAGDKKRGRSGSSRCLLPSASVLGRRQVCGGSGAPRWRCSCKGTFALNGAEAAHGFGVGRVAQDGRRRGWPGCPELTGRAPAVCGVCLGRDPFEVTVRQKRPRPDLKPAQREDFMKLGSPCQSAGDKKRGRSGSSRCLLPSASVLGRRQVCGGSGAPRWRCSCKGTFALNGAEAAHGFGVGRVAQDGRRRGWPGCPELTGRAPAVCGVCLGRDPFEVTVRQKRPRPDLKPAQREDFMKLGSPCQSAGDKKRGRSGSSRCLLPSASVLGRRQVCGGSGAPRWRCSCKGTFALNGAEAAHGFGVGRVAQDGRRRGWPGCPELTGRAPAVCGVCLGRDPFEVTVRQKRPRPDLKPAQREDFMKLGSPCQSAGDKKRGRSGSSRCLLPSASVLGRRQVCGGSGAPRWRCSCKGTFALNGAEAAHGFGVGRVAQDGRRRGWPGCPELTGRAPAVCGVCLGRDPFEVTVRQKRPRPDLKPAQREDFMKLGSPCQSAGDKKRGRSGSSRCLLPSASVLGRRQVCGGSGAPRWRCSCKGTFALNGAEAAHGFGVGRVAQDGRRRGWPGCPELTGRAPAVCGVCLGRDPFEVTVRQKRPRPDLKPAQREDFMKLGSPCQSAGDKKRGRSGSSRCLLPSASVLGRRQVCGGSGAPRWRCSCKGTFALNGAEAAHGFGVGRVAQDGRRRGWPGCPELTGRAPAVCGVCLGRDPFEVTVRQKRPRPDLKPAQREDFMKLGSPCQSAGDKKRGRSGSSRCLLPSASVLGRRQVCGGSGAPRWRCSCKGTFALNGAEAAHGFGVGRVAQDGRRRGWPGCPELTGRAPAVCGVCLGRDPFEVTVRQKRPRPDLKPAQREDFMKLGSPCQSAGDKKRGRSGSSRCLLPSASVLGRRQVCGGSGAPRWRCSCKGTFALNGAEAAHGFGVGRVAQDGRRRGWPGCPELTGRAPAVCGVCLGRDPFEVTVRQKRPRPDLKPAQREDFMKLGSPCQSAGDKKRGRSGSSRCLLPSASVLGRRQVCGGSGAPRWRCSCKGTFALNGAEAAHGFGVGRVAQDGRRRGWPGCPELTGRAPAVCGVCLGRDPFEVTVRQKRPRPDLKPAQREDFMKLGSPCQSAGDKKRGRSGSSRCLLPSASVLGRRQVCGGSGAPRWRCSCKGTFALNGAEAAHGFGVGRVAQDGRRRGWPGCPELTGRAPAVCGVCLGRDPFEVTVRQKRPRPDLKPAQREDFMKLGSPCQSAGDKKRGRSGSSRCLLPSASVLGRRQVCGGSGAPRWRCSCKGTFALNGAEAAHGFGVGRVAQDGRRRGWPGCPELTGRAPAVCGVCLGRDPFEVTVR
ncbi:hypothetical protein SRHO_G00186740 [Serrasalmus rhombeus]